MEKNHLFLVTRRPHRFSRDRDRARRREAMCWEVNLCGGGHVYRELGYLLLMTQQNMTSSGGQTNWAKITSPRSKLTSVKSKQSWVTRLSLYKHWRRGVGLIFSLPSQIWTLNHFILFINLTIIPRWPWIGWDVWGVFRAIRFPFRQLRHDLQPTPAKTNHRGKRFGICINFRKHYETFHCKLPLQPFWKASLNLNLSIFIKFPTFNHAPNFI